MAAIVGARLLAYNVPLASPRAFKGQLLSERQGLVVALHFADGTVGFGEAAPLPGFSRESYDDCIASLKTALPKLISDNLLETTLLPPAVQFALDCARHKIPYQQQSVKTQRLLQGSNRQILKSLDKVPHGETVKLKLGRQALMQDIALVQEVVSTRADLTFNLDVNQLWTLAQALKFASHIPQHNIGYFEEPCQHFEHSLDFAEQSGAALALDETLQVPGFHLKPHPNISTLIIKPTLIGGLETCKELIAQALKVKISCNLSSSFESSLGIGQLTHLANTWLAGETCGLDTLPVMTTDIISKSKADKPLISMEQLACLWQS